MVDGQVVRSCVTPVSAVGRRAVTTLEGLGSSAKPSVVQQAFIDEQAAQCGYCINGMVISATALLQRKRNPSEAEIREALAGNLCRCGTHTRIIKAVQRAAQQLA
jgi:nicotinate dehydrogenase subunit A